VGFLLIPDGESQKNEKVLFRVLKGMSISGLQRDSCLVALGGGVIGDLGGVAASLYMRGIDFVNCPTTLLAQVDAAVGGKTAVDFAGIKNLVGTFHQPKCVVIDPETLNTLDKRQLRTGLAEIIKYGVIQDKELFSLIERGLEKILVGDTGFLTQLIRRSCAIKARIVTEDEREGGKRAWLNYGHTLGHALESHLHYKILTHGEAVAYGMWFAALLSLKMGLCSNPTVERQRRLLERAGLFRELPSLDFGKIYQKMLLDKKARNGRILFVLTRKIGVVTIQKNVPKSAIFWAFKRIQGAASPARDGL
jgi:3-dehydroquinate synthase